MFKALFDPREVKVYTNNVRLPVSNSMSGCTDESVVCSALFHMVCAVHCCRCSAQCTVGEGAVQCFRYSVQSSVEDEVCNLSTSRTSILGFNSTDVCSERDKH